MGVLPAQFQVSAGAVKFTNVPAGLQVTSALAAKVMAVPLAAVSVASPVVVLAVIAR